MKIGLPKIGDVLLTPYPQANPKNQKGPTYNIQAYKGKGRYRLQILNPRYEEPLHFHSGVDISKDPEDIIVLNGRATFIFYDKQRNQIVSMYITANDSGGLRLLIPSYLLHQIKALQTTICLEQRISSHAQNNCDTIPQAQFEEYLRQIEEGKRHATFYDHTNPEEITTYDQYLQAPMSIRESADIFPFQQRKIKLQSLLDKLEDQTPRQFPIPYVIEQGNNQIPLIIPLVLTKEQGQPPANDQTNS